MRAQLSPPHTKRQPLHIRLASFGAAGVAFLAAYEPNLALRYGPFLAVATFILASPLRHRIGKTEIALLAYVIWSFISQFWSVSPETFAVRFTIVASLGVMFLGVRAVIRHGNSAAFVLAGYVAGCVVGLALTSLELISSDSVIRDFTGRVTQVDDLNVNYVAYGCVTAIILLVFAIRTRSITARRLRFVVWPLIVFLGVGVLSTQTRGAQIALVLFIIWLLISKFGRPLKLVLALATISAAVISSGILNEQLAVLDYGDRSISGLSGRLELWQIARDAWESHPLLGVGLGATRSLNVNNLPTHNTFLELGATVGTTGLLLFVLFVSFSQSDRTALLTDPERRFRVAGSVVAFLPIMLSSAWEMSASGWVGLALLSQPLQVATQAKGDNDDAITA